MCHPRAVVVAGRVDEHLRLALQPAERLRVEDAVAVALERRPYRAFLLDPEPAAVLVRTYCERRKPAFLLRANARLEGVGNSSDQVRHDSTLEDDRDGSAVRGPSRARDVRGPFGAEKGDHGGDLLGLGKATDRPSLCDLLEHVLARFRHACRAL